MIKTEDLPEDYSSFLLRYKEHRLENKKHEVFLWQIEHLEQFNVEYESQLYAPNYYFIGSNGSGIGLAYNKNNYKLFTIPFIGMDEADALFVADNFKEFIELFKKNKIELY